MLINKNFKNATNELKVFLNRELKKIYPNNNIKVKQNTIQYGFYDDNDYNCIFETMFFEMSDNKKYELYFSKQQRYLKEK